MNGTGSDLCLRCGMCCDGSLFDHAAVNSKEADALRGTRAQVTANGDGLALRLPCGALEGKCCTVYAQRPATCRTFRCNLLRNLERGTISFDRAAALVDEALDLAKRAGLSTADGPVLKQALRAAWRGEQRELAGKLAEILALHFLPDHE